MLQDESAEDTDHEQEEKGDAAAVDRAAQATEVNGGRSGGFRPRRSGRSRGGERRRNRGGGSRDYTAPRDAATGMYKSFIDLYLEGCMLFCCIVYLGHCCFEKHGLLQTCTKMFWRLWGVRAPQCAVTSCHVLSFVRCFAHLQVSLCMAGFDAMVLTDIAISLGAP